ncbi:MAG: hypothetical protein WCD53_05440, partial [Microcoleus sp.]
DPSIARRRYLGHDTGECDASFGLYRLQLNKLKVTLVSAASLTSLYNQVEANITPKGRLREPYLTGEGTIPLQPRKGIDGD